MEKFINLPEEKQNAIIDAALKVFGSNSYKKASVSDIAAEAGISKAMVFHYFGTKKGLYLYLIQLCSDIIVNEIKTKFDETVTDFFDRITQSSDIKLAAMKKHAAIPVFMTTIFFEKDEEVRKDIEDIMANASEFRNHLAFDGMDTSKFKDGVDVKRVLKMLIWMAEGFTNEMFLNNNTDFDAMCQEFYLSMELMKKNLYRDS